MDDLEGNRRMVRTMGKDREVLLEVEGEITAREAPAAGQGRKSKGVHARHGNGINIMA